MNPPKAPASTPSSKPGPETASGSRKAWVKKTPSEVVLGEIRKQEARVAEMRKELEREERELQKLQAARKALEA
jgi:uncharacterized small protein (DUF1192 family)